MDADRWRLVQKIFHATLDRPESARPFFLDRVCADDSALRAEVASLLDADAHAPGILDAPAPSLAALLTPDESDTRAGEHIGGYRLIREIGRGGMGVVYLAEREATPGVVAMKLIRGDLTSPELNARLVHEGRVLARLEHPHIARLLDVGVGPHDDPWLAMEFVDGQPIDRYCDAHRLPIGARLALFATVCGAVQHAHAGFVVHRDIKPSNIFVTPAGDVKLLDFGIAKLLGDDASTGPRTNTGVRLMTPEYASPEQVRGKGVTAASDVYALGLLLYELLTGHRAYRIASRSAGMIERAVLHEVPLPPSRAVALSERDTRGGRTYEVTAGSVSAARATTPAALECDLEGDLDAIVLRALEKRPEDRYPSAWHLVDDIRRHEHGVTTTSQPHAS